MSKSHNLIFVFLIIIISLFTLYPSFGLGLFGDDWLAFFRYVQHLGPNSSGEWNYFDYYLTPYGSQDMIMGILHLVYGFNSSLYYITSFILRIIASFSLFPLVFYMTKSKISAFSACFFFSVTVIGLDTTNWVFNMPTYITLSLFFLSLYFFISARTDKSKLRLAAAAILYYFAYITSPIRMHGSLPFFFLIEFFWFLQNKNVKTLKLALSRFGIILLVFLIIRYTGTSTGPANEISERFNMGITSTLQFLALGRFDFLFYPVVMLGSMIFPDFLLNSPSVNSIKQIVMAILPTLIVTLISVFLLLRTIGNFKSKIFTKLLSAFLLWTFIVIIVAKGNLAYFNSGTLIKLLLIGGIGIILTIYFIFKNYKQKDTINLMFLAICWTFSSFFFAWWWVPASIFPTTYRYMIMPAAGIAVLFATIISLGKDKSSKLFLMLLLTPLIVINIVASRLYLNYSLISHNQKMSDKIWASFPVIPEISKDKDPFIFYFEGDETNSGIIHDVITFGFPPHMALLYGLTASDPIPVPMSDFKEVVSAITDGKTMPAYGYKVKPVQINRIYAFHLQGADNLINITEPVRNKLKELQSNK